jgi:hypothetical protein
MLWCLKFPPISSIQSIFLPQRVIRSFRVCRSSPKPCPPRPDPRPPPQTTRTHHAKREANAIDCSDDSSGEDLERRPSLTPPCSVANTFLISRSLQLPPAPSQGIACHRLLPAPPDVEPRRQGRPTKSSCLKRPSPSDPVLLAGESSNHAFLLISPVLFRVS